MPIYLFLLGLFVFTPAHAMDVNAVLEEANKKISEEKSPPKPLFSSRAELMDLIIREGREPLESYTSVYKLEPLYWRVLVNDYGVPPIQEECSGDETDATCSCIDNFSGFPNYREANTSFYRLIGWVVQFNLSPSKTDADARYLAENFSRLQNACSKVPGLEAATRALMQDVSHAAEEHLKSRVTAQKKQREIQEARAQCFTSAQFKLWQSAQRVHLALGLIERGQSGLEREDAVSAESGVENLNARYRAGEDVSHGKKLLTREFEQYKKLGGKAVKPELVPKTPSPCGRQ